MGVPGVDLLVGRIKLEVTDINQSIENIKKGLGGSVEDVEKKIISLQKEIKGIAKDIEGFPDNFQELDFLLDEAKRLKVETQQTAKAAEDYAEEQKKAADELERIVKLEEERAQIQSRAQRAAGILGRAEVATQLLNATTQFLDDAGERIEKQRKEFIEAVEEVPRTAGRKTADAILTAAPAVGTAIGVVAGAKLGATAGGVLGTVIPVLGTSLGVIGGAALGGAFGGAVGKVLQAAERFIERLGSNFALSSERNFLGIPGISFAQDPNAVDPRIIARNERAIEAQKIAEKEEEQQRQINDVLRQQRNIRADIVEDQDRLKSVLQEAGAEQIAFINDIARRSVDTSALEDNILAAKERLAELNDKEKKDNTEIQKQRNVIIGLENQLLDVRRQALQDLSTTALPLLRLGIESEDVNKLFEVGKEFEDKFATPFQEVAKVIGQLSEGQGTADDAVGALRRLGLLDVVARAGGTDAETLTAEARAARGDTDVGIRNEILTILLSLIGDAGGEFDRRVSPIGQAEEALAKEARATEQQIINQKETIKTIEEQIRVTEKQLDEEQDTRRDTVQPLEQAARAFQLAGLGSQEQLLKDQLDKQKEALDEAKDQNDKLKEANKELEATKGHSKRAADALDKLSRDGIGARVAAGTG